MLENQSKYAYKFTWSRKSYDFQKWIIITTLWQVSIKIFHFQMTIRREKNFNSSSCKIFSHLKKVKNMPKKKKDLMVYVRKIKSSCIVSLQVYETDRIFFFWDWKKIHVFMCFSSSIWKLKLWKILIFALIKLGKKEFFVSGNCGRRKNFETFF